MICQYVSFFVPYWPKKATTKTLYSGLTFVVFAAFEVCRNLNEFKWELSQVLHSIDIFARKCRCVQLKSHRTHKDWRKTSETSCYITFFGTQYTFKNGHLLTKSGFVSYRTM